MTDLLSSCGLEDAEEEEEEEEEEEGVFAGLLPGCCISWRVGV
jgi:hypothetical protein